MHVLKWTSCSVQVDIFPPFSPFDKLTRPSHVSRPSSLYIPLSSKKFSHFFFFPKNTFFVIFYYIFSQSFVLFRKPFKPIYRSSFFFSLPLPYPSFFRFLCTCSFLFYFLRVIAFGSVGVKRRGRGRVEWMKGVEQKNKKRDEGIQLMAGRYSA